MKKAKKEKVQGEKPKKTEVLILVLLLLTIIFAGITFIQKYMTPFQPLNFLASTEFEISIVAIACLFIAWAIVVRKKKPQNYVDLKTTPEKKEYNIPNPLEPQKKMEFVPPPSNLLKRNYELNVPNHFSPQQQSELKRVPNPLNGYYPMHQYRQPDLPVMGTWRCECGHLAFGRNCVACGRMRK